MSKEFMNLEKEYRIIYEENINKMLITIIQDERFEDTIRNLCKQSLDKNWDLSKKINIINIVTQY